MKININLNNFKKKHKNKKNQILFIKTSYKSNKTMPKTTFQIFILFALALSSISFASVEAKSTRSFSGSNPAEVEKNAKKAGFDYPDGEMKCSSRCNQRWAKE